MRASSATTIPIRQVLLPLGAAALGLLVAGCEVTETTTTYHSGPMCPQIYDPVCAERWGNERTFPNACEARAEGWRIVADGQCRADYYRDHRRGRDYRDYDDYRDYQRDRDRDDRRRDRDRPVQPPPPVQPDPPAPPSPPSGACPQVFEQVCGQIGNTTRRFMNRCELERAGAAEVAAGLCMGGDR